MPAESLEYRLRIRNQANDGNLLILSSRATDPNCLLTEEPEGDGQRIDWAEGTSEVGVQTWVAWDRDDGSDARTITAQLADAFARNQALSNLCVGEFSKDGGAWTAFHTGYLNAITLIDAGTFELKVGDTNRREQDAELFKFLTPTFNRGACLLGGPILARTPTVFGGTPQPSFANGRVKDYGPIRMHKVAATGGTGTIALEIVSGYVRPYYRQLLTSVGADEVETINRLARDWAVPINPNTYTSGGRRIFSAFPALVARLRRVSDGATFDVTPLAVPVVSTTADTDKLVIGKNLGLYLKWPVPLIVPSNGTQYDVTIFPNEISDKAPIHWAGNPIDLVTLAWTQEGIAYDAVAASAVRAALGNLWVEYAWTAKQALTEVVAKAVFGPYGVGARLNANAEKVLFLTRGSIPSSVDTVTIDDLIEASDHGDA